MFAEVGRYSFPSKNSKNWKRFMKKKISVRSYLFLAISEICDGFFGILESVVSQFILATRVNKRLAKMFKFKFRTFKIELK